MLKVLLINSAITLNIKIFKVALKLLLECLRSMLIRHLLDPKSKFFFKDYLGLVIRVVGIERRLRIRRYELIDYIFRFAEVFHELVVVRCAHTHVVEKIYCSVNLYYFRLDALWFHDLAIFYHEQHHLVLLVEFDERVLVLERVFLNHEFIMEIVHVQS